MNNRILLSLILLLAVFSLSAQYQGTGSVTQGTATTTISNLYPNGGRVAGIGTIVSTDNQTWTVPASTNYADNDFPFCPDMYNADGTTYNSAANALATYSSDDIVEIDTDGDIYTAYIFADNYFELYINGTFVGKDAIPFTDFNSHIIQFKVNRPFTIAMLLVDWEENLGLGSEEAQGFSYIPGDGGMVAVIKDADNEIVATTGDEWKAQTFYTSPVKDLSCPTEDGSLRLTDDCDTEGSNDGTSYYGLHWAIDSDWSLANFDDSDWPNAYTYTNTTIGVSNKPSYTNFTDIFDDNSEDAEFIWSSNVILDNLVLTRYTVTGTSNTYELPTLKVNIFPNPASDNIYVETDGRLNFKVTLFDSSGRVIYRERNINSIDVASLISGVYMLEVLDLDSNNRIQEKITIVK